MSVYMITYYISDTCGCGHNHDEHEHTHEHIESSEDKIIGKIKSVGAWARFMPEGFLVKSNLSSDEIFKEIKSVSNAGDILFVTKVDPTSCACGNPAVIDWINQ